MITFTYDQAYKINYDIKQSKANRDLVAVSELNYHDLPELFENYVDMCQVLPTSAPSLTVPDEAIQAIAKFYRMRAR